MGHWLVGLETTGNQSYIFASNRLMESVGASHLLRAATTEWVRDAVAEATAAVGSERCRELQLTSGRAVLLVDSEDRSIPEAIVEAVTLRALLEAPGLHLTGAVLLLGVEVEIEALKAAMRALQRRLADNAARLPGAAARHPRLPIGAECGSTGAGAAAIVRAHGESLRVSAAVAARRAAAEGAWTAIRDWIGDDIELPRNLQELEDLVGSEEAGRWVAVVHADINGLGQAVMGLDAQEDAGGYLEALESFAKAIDNCAQTALRAALRTVSPYRGVVPVVPLIAAGDDLTAVLPGAYALRFAATYVRELERASERDDWIGMLVAAGRVSACAGIAVVKPHHPFSDAYRLADDLAGSAKRVKRLVAGEPGDGLIPCSAIDFQLVYDAIGLDLAEHRARLTTDHATSLLHNRPYVVTPRGELAGAGEEGRQWAELHHLGRLEDRRARMMAEDPEDPGAFAIPRSAVMALREVLAEGHRAVEARARVIRSRAPAIGTILSDGAVFRAGAALDDGERVTDLLDAIDCVELSGERSVLP